MNIFVNNLKLVFIVMISGGGGSGSGSNIRWLAL